MRKPLSISRCWSLCPTWAHSFTFSSITSYGLSTPTSVLYSSNPVKFFTPDQMSNFKYIKDLGSFWRLVFNIVINIFYIKMYNKKKQSLAAKMLFLQNQRIQKDTEAYKDLDELLEARFEFRTAWIEVIHSTVRLAMLWKALRFPL